MKKAITAIIIIVIILIVWYLYITRAPSAPSTDIEEAAGNITATSSQIIYQINPTESQAKFSIGEILNDKPFTAVGTTNEIAGEIAISGNSITIGTIAINARTFKTDNERRDGAISRAILKAEDPANEFIYFKSSPVENMTLPQNESSTLAFNLPGEMTVAGVTKPVLFEVQMTIGEDKINGVAKATIKRSDFGLIIPNVPFVASVDDEFTVSATIEATKAINAI